MCSCCPGQEGWHSDQVGALLGALVCGRLQVVQVTHEGAQPAMAGTLLPVVGLLTNLTRLELPSVEPPLKVII